LIDLITGKGAGAWKTKHLSLFYARPFFPYPPGHDGWGFLWPENKKAGQERDKMTGKEKRD